MPFSRAVRDEALLRSRRCCCICREFAGRPINVHHIVPEAQGGSNTLDNAVPLCDRCHSQVSHYNPKQPVGTSYSPKEVKEHRDRFWAEVASNPGVPLPAAPISISPTRIVLPTNRAEEVHYELSINNNSNVVLYGASIALTIADVEAGGFDLDFGTITPEAGMAVKLPGTETTWFTGLLRMDFTAPGGERFHVLSLRRLEPHTTYRLPLTIRARSPEDVSVQAGFSIVTLTNFSRTPAPSRSRPSPLEPGQTEHQVFVEIFEARRWIGVSPVASTGVASTKSPDPAPGEKAREIKRVQKKRRKRRR